jgi:hypothetical protein
MKLSWLVSCFGIFVSWLMSFHSPSVIGPTLIPTSTKQGFRQSQGGYPPSTFWGNFCFWFWKFNNFKAFRSKIMHSKVLKLIRGLFESCD